MVNFRFLNPMEKEEGSSVPTMFPPACTEYSLDQLQLGKAPRTTDCIENIDNNSMGTGILDMFNIHHISSGSAVGCSTALEKMSFADVMQFADYGSKVPLSQAMDDENEATVRSGPENSFDPVYFLKFPVLATDQGQKPIDHKNLDQNIHEVQITLATESDGNYHTTGNSGSEHLERGNDVAAYENTSNLNHELNLSTDAMKMQAHSCDEQQQILSLDTPKIGSFSTSNCTPDQPPQCKPKRKRSRACKNSEEVESQRMTHIAVERNRRKQMNEHLRVLRSLMPGSYVQRGDQASIIGGAIEFVRELEQLLQCLESQKRRRLYAEASSSLVSAAGARQPQTDHAAGCLPIQANYPVFSVQPEYGNLYNEPIREDLAENKSPVADIEVKLVGYDAMIKILSQRRPGQLLKTIAALENLQFSIMHTNITTIEQTVLYSFNVKVGGDCGLSAEDIANSVHQIFNMIHASCMGYINE